MLWSPNSNFPLLSPQTHPDPWSWLSKCTHYPAFFIFSNVSQEFPLLRYNLSHKSSSFSCWVNSGPRGLNQSLPTTGWATGSWVGSASVVSRRRISHGFDKHILWIRGRRIRGLTRMNALKYRWRHIGLILSFLQSFGELLRILCSLRDKWPRFFPRWSNGASLRTKLRCSW